MILDSHQHYNHTQSPQTSQNNTKHPRTLPLAELGKTEEKRGGFLDQFTAEEKRGLGSSRQRGRRVLAAGGGAPAASGRGGSDRGGLGGEVFIIHNRGEGQGVSAIMLQRRRRKRPRPSLDHRRVQPAVSATGEGRVHELSAATEEEEELKQELSATQPKGRKEETTTQTSSTDEDDRKCAQCGELDTTEAKEEELSGRGTRQGIEVELGGAQLGDTVMRKGSRSSGAQHSRRWSSAAAHGSR